MASPVALSRNSFVPIHATAAPPANLRKLTESNCETKNVATILRATAAPAPSRMPRRRCAVGRFFTASAMTTALSPASTRSMRMMPRIDAISPGSAPGTVRESQVTTSLRVPDGPRHGGSLRIGVTNGVWPGIVTDGSAPDARPAERTRSGRARRTTGRRADLHGTGRDAGGRILPAWPADVRRASTPFQRPTRMVDRLEAGVLCRGGRRRRAAVRSRPRDTVWFVSPAPPGMCPADQAVRRDPNAALRRASNGASCHRLARR